MDTKDSDRNLKSIIRDQTAELEKTKNYLENILKYSTDMIITTDLEGRIVTFNQGAEEMLGYEKSDVIGRQMEDYYCRREDRGRILEMLKKDMIVANYETQLVRKDGKIIDISLSLSLLKDEHGKVIGTVGISKDITDLKAAQRQLNDYSTKLESMVKKRTVELEESKSHLEAMLSGIADGVVFADQENRITFINDAAESIFDIRRDTWMGKDFEAAHSSKAHKKALQLIREMKEGKIRSYSSEIRSGEKTIFAHFSPIMHGPEYLGIIFIARDISEMKRLQTELVQSEKLALVGKMSSTIAHELRNPLVPIGGFARLINRRMDENSPLRKYSEIIIREIDRLERLLRDLLYFTRDIKPALQPVRLNDLIDELLTLYRATIAESSIRTKVHLSPDIPILSLDHSKIKQALINILHNSIQAMPDGGLLTVESRMIEKDGKIFASVVITDTGEGIPEDLKNKIFDPFYTTKVQGLGLGLTLTKEIVEAHGGRINVESTEGEGTTFIITLPLPHEDS